MVQIKKPQIQISLFQKRLINHYRHMMKIMMVILIMENFTGKLSYSNVMIVYLTYILIGKIRNKFASHLFIYRTHIRLTQDMKNKDNAKD